MRDPVYRLVELEARVELADDTATFTPVRALRQMPALRMLRPTFRSSRVAMEALHGLRARKPIHGKETVVALRRDLTGKSWRKRLPNRKSRRALAPLSRKNQSSAPSSALVQSFPSL